MKRALIALALLLGLGAHAQTLRNDDSCDIVTLPAATLLLPYFEVDLNLPQAQARTTLFTVVNTSQYPQIARATIWTDWAYPVLDFNIFLTGYDVQAINLYDILGPRASFAPPNGTSSDTPPGSRSLLNTSNPNFASTVASDCAQLPGVYPPALWDAARTALAKGTISTCSSPVGSHKDSVGGVLTRATGYITIDVVKTCGVAFPTDEAYYNDLLYDNVLTGDYQIISPNAATGNYAGGNPLVHIRAIPEGGPAGVMTPTNLPYTFYDRYTPRGNENARTMDRRQPLPAVFAARFIQGGTGAFNTNLQVWREGVTGSNAACTSYAANGGVLMKITDMVRFDEHENPTSNANCGIILIPCVPFAGVLPAASSTGTDSSLFPLMSGAAADPGGWLYLNLSNGGSQLYSAKRPFNVNNTTVRPNQNWVTVSMSAEGRYQASFDAVMMANGCSVAPAITNSISEPIAPGGNITP